MGYRVSEVTEAITGRFTLGQWEKARLRVIREREAVEAFVRGGGTAYGFTTFFGHLDSIAGPDNQMLLRGHIVGYPDRIPAHIVRGIMAVKLCQLANGGSGISEQTFTALLTRFEDDIEGAEIDLYASYGSGDVVPGAWFSRFVLGDNPVIPDGDLMALINGSFVAAGIVLGLRGEIQEVVDAAIKSVEHAAEIANRYRQSPHVQLPVSLRDTMPLAVLAETQAATMDHALENSLNSSSGNPLFSIEDGLVEPKSNSSFLDFELTLALQNQLELVRVISAYVTAAIRWLDHVTESVVPDVEKPLTVQYPKVAKAYNDRLAATAGTATYIQAESRDVEDISDGALIRVLKLQENLTILVHETGLLDDICAKLQNY